MQLKSLTEAARRMGFALAAALVLAGPLAAQGLFSPAIIVNDQVITRYELEQRERFLILLNAPGNPAEQAREQLIDDRLKLTEVRRAGLLPTEEELAAGVAEFAGRANLSAEELVEALEANGVARQTLVDFVQSGIGWRNLVQTRFAGRAEVSEGEVDRAIGGEGAGNVRVRLAEIVMPIDPARQEEVRARAAEISEYTTEAQFADAARRFSAAPSASAGGQLPWQELTRLPPGLRPIILGLAPGEVSDPIPLEGALALFQLRDIEETEFTRPEYAAIEFATYLIPGGRSEAALSEAARIRASVDRCDDLYGVNLGQPDERLERVSLPPGEVPQDIAMELSKLDDGEISTMLTRRDSAGNANLVLLMLCGRTPEISEDVSREEIEIGLRNRRLASYADSLLQQLRSEARIIEP
jgi:peptidyl-prolyl cis-trans isomerase SurA